MRSKYTRWALSRKFDGKRRLLNVFCWDIFWSCCRGQPNVALFATRKQAREAQATCLCKGTRVETVRVTVETIAASATGGE